MSESPNSPQPVKLTRAVASRVRRLRDDRGLSQDALATLMRGHGFMHWTRSVVAALEAGSGHLSLEEAIGLALALNCSVLDLVPGRGVVGLGETGELQARTLRDLLRGEVSRGATPYPGRRISAKEMSKIAQSYVSLTYDPDGPPPGWEDLRDAVVHVSTGTGKSQILAMLHVAAMGSLEQDLARALERDAHWLVILGYAEWGRAPTEERDHRSRDRPEARQHASREIRRELTKLVDQPDLVLTDASGRKVVLEMKHHGKRS
jgi:transcriptional regulator with XRE-family HTH domain